MRLNSGIRKTEVFSFICTLPACNLFILCRRLIHLIPTDGEVCDSLESVSHINSMAADASPKMSPR
jgi:hypothetical protein